MFLLWLITDHFHCFAFRMIEIFFILFHFNCKIDFTITITVIIINILELLWKTVKAWLKFYHNQTLIMILFDYQTPQIMMHWKICKNYKMKILRTSGLIVIVKLILSLYLFRLVKFINKGYLIMDIIEQNLIF